jgi:transposase
MEMEVAQRTRERAARAGPVLNSFFAWADDEQLQVLPETPIGKAVTYARNQRVALARFLDDGRLRLDNNRSERELRREAVGRKNWLFVGSDDGAKWNAAFVSLIASCQQHKLEPWAYLRDLFCLLPDWPNSRVLDLAPKHWRQTREQAEVQQRLAATPLRAISLAPHSQEATQPSA